MRCQSVESGDTTKWCELNKIATRWGDSISGISHYATFARCRFLRASHCIQCDTSLLFGEHSIAATIQCNCVVAERGASASRQFNLPATTAHVLIKINTKIYVLIQITSRACHQPLQQWTRTTIIIIISNQCTRNEKANRTLTRRDLCLTSDWCDVEQQVSAVTLFIKSKKRRGKTRGGRGVEAFISTRHKNNKKCEKKRFQLNAMCVVSHVDTHARRAAFAFILVVCFCRAASRLPLLLLAGWMQPNVKQKVTDKKKKCNWRSETDRELLCNGLLCPWSIRPNRCNYYWPADVVAAVAIAIPAANV